MEMHNILLANLALSPRTLNALWRGNITEVAEVLTMSDKELTGIRNLGEKCLIELNRWLSENNLNRGQEGPGLTSPDALSLDSWRCEGRLLLAAIPRFAVGFRHHNH